MRFETRLVPSFTPQFAATPAQHSTCCAATQPRTAQGFWLRCGIDAFFTYRMCDEGRGRSLPVHLIALCLPSALFTACFASSEANHVLRWIQVEALEWLASATLPLLAAVGDSSTHIGNAGSAGSASAAALNSSMDQPNTPTAD